MAEGPDKGRSWVVAVAALIINMITAGIFRAQGLLFVEFINFYEVDRKAAAMPFSVRTAVRNLLAPVVGILGQKYGAPVIIVIGGILGSLSSVLCFFAPDIVWMTVIWGVMNGFAMSLITVLPAIVVNQYFFKHRSTATGLAFSGSCMSAIVLPSVLEILLKNYGLNGTFFILAGMILHTIPSGMLLRPPPWLKYGRKENNLKIETQENGIVEEDKTNVRIYKKASTSQKKCECGVQVGNDRVYDFGIDRRVLRDAECKHHTLPRNRSHSYSGLTHQMRVHNLQRSNIFPTISSIEMNCRSFTSNPELIFDVELDYLKRHSELVFHMLSMEIPNVEISYRAILLEVEQNDLWHPDQNEIMQEIENIYFHIERSLEVDQISNKSFRPNGLYIKRTLLNGALTISKKSESLRVVKRYLKTYKERGLEQLRKIRSAPNMSNIYNELARRDYVMTKLKQLSSSNEIRIISHLCQYNPKHVLKVLFQIRTLYKLYNDIESCDQCESNELSDTGVETGDISMHRKDSSVKPVVDSKKESEGRGNTFKVHIKAAIDLHRSFIFLLICCSRAAFIVTFNPVITTIVDFAMDRGLEEKDGKFVIGVLGMGDLLGRLCFGWITDRGYVSLPRYMLVAMIALGLSSILIPFMYSRWAILSILVFFGMFQGSLFIRHPVLLAKYLRPQEQSIAVGCMEFLSGIICLLLPSYIGFFRDNLGSYNQIYYINGILVMLCGFAWQFEPRIIHRTETNPK